MIVRGSISKLSCWGSAVILVHLMLVNQAKFGFWEAAQPDIFHDAAFKNLIQFLMDSQETPCSKACFGLLKRTGWPLV